MLSKARVGTHPIHPMLVAYPLALWTGAVLFDAVAKFGDRSYLHMVAYYMIVLGCAGAVAAAIPGLIDLFGATPSGTPVRATAWTHGLLNVAALVVFALGAWSRHQHFNTMTRTGYITDILGVLILACSGWLGGALVYDHHVGVAE